MVSKKEILSAVALIVFVGFFSASKFGAFDSPSPCESLSPEMKFLNDEFHVLLSKDQIIREQKLTNWVQKEKSLSGKTEIWTTGPSEKIVYDYYFENRDLQDVKLYFLGKNNPLAQEFKNRLLQNLGESSGGEFYMIWDINHVSKQYHVVFSPTFEEDWEGYKLWIGARTLK